MDASPLLPAPADGPDVGEYVKRRIALRYWLLGAGMTTASAAMTFAQDRHTGTRRDGVTPEFAHQVAIVSYLRTLLPHLIYPDETLAAGFLHDVSEDYGVSGAQLSAMFGPRVARSVALMTIEAGTPESPFDPFRVYSAMADDEIASIVKLADRIHNLDSVLGVFTADKARAYVAETREWHLRVARRARKLFPTQEPAYENAKLVLLAQMKLITALTDQV